MARDPHIEARLQRWADWLTVGDGDGYASVSVLSADWQPPTPGQRPSLKVANYSDARETHRAVRQLSARLQATLLVHYCKKLSVAEQAQELGCERRTVLERVERAHRQLATVLAEFCNLHSSG